METVSNKFRPTLYSGEANHTAVLTIGNTTIDNENIKSIKVSNPIIDKTNETFYIGTFVSKQVEIELFNAEEIDLTGELHLSIGTYIKDDDEYTLTEDETFLAYKMYYEYENSEYTEYTGERTGNPSNLGLYELVEGSGDYEMLDIGYFNIETSPEDYYKNAKITALDNAVKFKPNVDYSSALDPTTGLISCEDLLIWLCNHFEVTLGTYPNINRNIQISSYDSSKSGKQYISYIAEIMGGNAQIGRDGSLNIIPLKQNASVQIDATESKSWELGEKYQISGVTYFDVLRDIPFSSGTETYNTLYIRSDNPFVVGDNTAASAIIQNIYNAVVGTVIYNVKCENYADYSLDSWDFIEYVVDNNSYTTINNHEYTYEMTIMGKVDVEIPNKQVEQTTNTIWGNDTTKMNILKTTIDNVNNEIEILAEQVQPISDTTSGTTSITLENAYEGTLHYLMITGDITDIFPATDLYPSNTLYPKDTYLLVDNNRYHLDFTYLRYMSSTICDKWICEDGKQRVERYVGVDGNGNYYALTNPIIEEKEDLIITVSNYSTISMESFSNINLYCEYLLENEYTDTFAPTVDLIGKINLSPGNAQIQAQNIKLEGYTTINGNFGVDLEGNMFANNGNFSGNVYLQDGNKVIGGKGILTNLQFAGKAYGMTMSNSLVDPAGGFLLGFNGEQTGTSTVTYFRGYHVAQVYIPKGFSVEKAYITVIHEPITYDNTSGTSGTGYVRQLKAYNITNSFAGNVILTNYEYYFGGSPTFDSSTELTNAFGSSGYTFDSESVETKTSGDISSVFVEDNTNYSIAIASARAVPSSSTSKSISKFGPYTGFVTMFVNIIGYMSMEN